MRRTSQHAPTGKFEGTFTIPAGGDGQPYHYRFATNDDWADPNSAFRADWACTHRSQGVANLVDFHNYVANTPVTNIWDDGDNMIAFSRGSKGWIAINNHPTPQTQTFLAGLASGIYCDVIQGAFGKTNRAATCSGSR